MLKTVVKYPYKLMKNFFQTISKSRIAAWFRCEPRYRFSEDSSQFFSCFNIGDVIYHVDFPSIFYGVRKIRYHPYDPTDNTIIFSTLRDPKYQYITNEWSVTHFYKKVAELGQLECTKIKELQIKNGSCYE